MTQADEPERRGERPAAPQQPDTGFEKGLGEAPEDPATEPLPDFARGQENDPDGDEKPRFSRGEEIEPETPEHHDERRFSQGQERGTRDGS